MNSLCASSTKSIDRKKQFDQEWSIPQLSLSRRDFSNSNVSTLNNYTLYIHTHEYHECILCKIFGNSGSNSVRNKANVVHVRFPRPNHIQNHIHTASTRRLILARENSPRAIVNYFAWHASALGAFARCQKFAFGCFAARPPSFTGGTFWIM